MHGLGGNESLITRQVPQPSDAVRTLIRLLGDDPDRAALKETPARVVRFMQEWHDEQEQEIAVTMFDSEYDDLIVVRHVPVFSLCEHHMLPYYGSATVGYLPARKYTPLQQPGPPSKPVGCQIIGLSKIPRIVRRAASRLTVQEMLTGAIAGELVEHVGGDVGVVMRCVHTCMMIRGPRANGSETVTSTMLGQFRTESSLRAELLALERE